MTPKHLNIHNIYLFRYTNEEAEILETVSAPILVTTHDIGKSHPKSRMETAVTAAVAAPAVPAGFHTKTLPLSVGCRHPAAP